MENYGRVFWVQPDREVCQTVNFLNVLGNLFDQ